MYKKHTKFFQHPHSKFQPIPGYSNVGILLFTSKQKAQGYTISDRSIHGEPSNSTTPVVIKELTATELSVLLASMANEVPHDGKYNYKTVVFNLTNENKYDGIYNVHELLKLLQDKDSFCSVENGYEKEQFEKLIDLYNYQQGLTKKIDTYKHDFTQETINEIVLWKVNRYVNADTEWLLQLNDFKNDKEVKEEKLRRFLEIVLDKDVKGIRLAMASTFLRFRNPNVYQIIDERMFRVIMGTKNSEKRLLSYTTIDNQINLYIDYLKRLKVICENLNINYEQSDRILYQFDIIKNGDFN